VVQNSVPKQAAVVDVLARIKKEKNHFSLSVLGLMSPYPTWSVMSEEN
jgi:hypothetical protein